MIRMEIEHTLRIRERGYALAIRGDCSKVRIGSVLICPDGKELTVTGIGIACGVFDMDSLDVLVKEEIDPALSFVYLKE